LDDPVSHCRDAKRPFTAPFFGNANPFNRGRSVSPFPQFEQQAVQLQVQVGFKITQALPINSGRALRLSNLPKPFIERLLR
jgi:hypothetical protein